MGLWHALVCGFISFYCMEKTFLENGKELFFAVSGTVSFGASVIVGNLKVLLFSNTHSVMSLFFVFGSVLFYVSNHAFASYIFTTSDIYNTFYNAYSFSYFWFSYLIIIACTVILDMAYGRWNWYSKYSKINEK